MLTHFTNILGDTRALRGVNGLKEIITFNL